MQPTVPPAPWEVERALDDVFARPEFAPPPPSPVTAWLREAWGTAKRLLGEMFGGVDLSEGGQRVMFWIVIALLAAAALGVALHLAGAATGVWRARERRPRGSA
ncbi:MAG: hypothetical protein M3409_01305, partial [Gemmatimonadota bacterium]|nr:hypothetical protein [Gemmatimonadota bacterium]